jgi:type III secretory pathway lipoprotein EscJ
VKRFWATLLLALSVGAQAAHAEASRTGSATPCDECEGRATGALLVRLSARVSEQQQARTGQLEQRLSRLLAGWPGVQRAEVMLTLPHSAAVALDQPLPRASASVVLTRSGSEPSAKAVYQLLHTAVPSLAQSDLTLLEHAAASTTSASAVQLAARATAPAPGLEAGPAPAARTLANVRAGLAFSLFVNAFLALLVLWRLRTVRPSARKVDRRDRSPPAP